ncbi:hypothetical protein SAMN00777080_4691 [Aquiflexum balticum DSM 16537]|uniref:Uncharacterized protein n=1 Tax=Aquiflexum balticum DSM 16537 TaxID=758820 RepID=A0A1W2HAT3_9BACT|nr:hypothetical protein [Aquiflexum balticum]SMD46015.1 hypothetical protein SAMN00777080_4691 [Aquiflexum balticum DSM 16537]
MIARRIYLGLLIFSILIGVYFYGIAVENFDKEFLKIFSILPFFLFMAGVHGLFAHLLTPTTKSKMISYPLVMGMVYVLLFFIHLFVIVPIICPNF